MVSTLSFLAAFALFTSAFFNLASPSAAHGQSEVALTLTDSGYYTVPVQIQGQGPWPFVIDTGASNTLIVSSLAAEFGYQPTAIRDDVQSLTDLYRAEPFRLADVTMGLAHARELYTIIADIEADETVSAYGLLGVDIFSQSRSNRAHSFTVNFPELSLNFDAQPIEHGDAIISQERNLVFAGVTAGRVRRAHHALIDTGSPFTIVNSRMARRLQGFNTVTRVAVSDYAQRIELDNATTIRISRLQVGGLYVGPVYAVESNVDAFRALGWNDEPAMIIGLDVLEQGQLTIDYRTGNVQIDHIGPASRLCSDERIQYSAINQTH